MLHGITDLRNLSRIALLFLAIHGAVYAQAPEGGPPQDGGRRDRGGPPGGGFFGGRGGFGRGGGGVAGELRNTSTQEELGLTDDQKAQLEALNESRRAARDNNPKLQELFGKMRDADEEERQLLQAEIQIEMNKQTAEAEEQVKKSHRRGKADAPAADQPAPDRRVWSRWGIDSGYGCQGPGSLSGTEGSAGQAADEQRNAFREMGFNAAPEERQKMMDDYKARCWPF